MRHLLISLLALPLLCHAQGSAYVPAFMKTTVGLTDAELATVEKGQAIAKVVSSRNPSEVFVFGVVVVNARPEAYVRMASDISRLRALPGYLAIQAFSDPPTPANLNGFGLEPDDINDLKKCKPGDCEVQLPVENIERLRSSVDWSAPNVAQKINDVAKQRALELLADYRRGGNAALGTYRDKSTPTNVDEQFRTLLSRPSGLPVELPAFYSYLLDYPRATLPDSSSMFYWERVNFGLKPTLRVNQQITAHLAGKHGPVDVVAIKQLYSSHYFQTALDLNFCVPRDAGGIYLLTFKGSIQAGLTGFKGGILRNIAVGKTRSSLEKSLAAIKTQLEQP